MVRSRAIASRAPAAPLRAPLTRPPGSQNPAAIRGQGPDSAIPRTGNHDHETPEADPLRSQADAGKAATRAVITTFSCCWLLGRSRYGLRTPVRQPVFFSLSHKALCVPHREMGRSASPIYPKSALVTEAEAGVP
jgi:hypothetical protein